MEMRTLLALCLFLGLSSALPVTLSPVNENPLCTKCKWTMLQIQGAVKNINATYVESTIQYLDDNVCDKLPDSAQDTCKSIVEEEIPDIWEQIIDDYLDPQSTCVSIGVCKKGEEVKASLPPTADVECKLCKQTTTWIDENIFEDPEVVTKVAAQLKQVCSKLSDKGKPIETKCEEMIDDDAADLMASIGKSIALEVCEDLGVCPK